MYDERQPIEPSYPSVRPSIADFVVEVDDEGAVNGEGSHLTEEDELRFAPPG